MVRKTARTFARGRSAQGLRGWKHAAAAFQPRHGLDFVFVPPPSGPEAVLVSGEVPGICPREEGGCCMLPASQTLCTISEVTVIVISHIALYFSHLLSHTARYFSHTVILPATFHTYLGYSTNTPHNFPLFSRATRLTRQCILLTEQMPFQKAKPLISRQLSQTIQTVNVNKANRINVSVLYKFKSSLSPCSPRLLEP